MTVLRRLALLVTLMFWQGGFMFYGAVVVPVGSHVLGSHRDQGFVTRSVTNYLNGAGAVSLIVWYSDIRSGNMVAPGRRRWRWRFVTWGLLALSLCLQVWLHALLDRQLDLDSFRILDQPLFRSLHSWYLIVSTLQWACCLFLTAGTIAAWREADHNPVAS